MTQEQPPTNDSTGKLTAKQVFNLVAKKYLHCSLDDMWPTFSKVIIMAMEEHAKQEAGVDACKIADYEEVLADHRRIVKEIDIILHGKCAATLASLIDLIGPIKKLVAKAPEAGVSKEVKKQIIEEFIYAIGTDEEFPYQLHHLQKVKIKYLNTPPSSPEQPTHQNKPLIL